MRAQLQREDGALYMIVTPESTTEEVAMDHHARDLGFVWDPHFSHFKRRATKEPAP